MKTDRTLNRSIAATLLTILLLLTSVSCGNIDTIMDEAKDVIDEAGDVVKEVGEAIKDDSGDSTHEAGSGSQSGGGQTVVRPPRPTGTIATGAPTPLTSGPIGPNGGTITVQKPGDPLDGLEIQVPPGSYPDSRQFEVSSAPVNGHTFGEYFTPATQLVTIENGGEYSEEFITVRIPVEVPPDHFAMAFYFDGATGTLEGIPFNAIDEHSITIVTRHFCDIIVSIINNTLLDDLMKGDIDSHFRPGIDDWQFTNYGSYIAKNGHCAGQSISAMWYFCEQPDGEELTLHGRYDNNGNRPLTPALWQDDSYGYRFASTIQNDAAWDSYSFELQKSLRGADDALQYKAFAYAIQLTGEPQYVGISSNAGGGHAMIAYRVHDGNIYIADPNYPGNTERRIEFNNGAFRPYNSGANAEEIAAGRGKAYERIGYTGKTSFIDWNVIKSRWAEFKAGTIGNDRFPAYQITAVDSAGKEAPLVDGYESKDKSIAIDITANPTIGKKVYRDGNRLAQNDQGYYELEEGNNHIGVEIWGDVNNDPNNRRYKYIDFKYFNVQYGEEQQECSGWVLDSVDVVQDYGGVDTEYEQYVQPLVHNDGSFSYSVRYVVRDNSPGQPGGEIYVTYTTSGSWTPLPDCLNPDDPIRVELQMRSSVDAPSASEAPNFDDIRGILDCAMTGRVDQTVSREVPSLNESTIVELLPLHEGTEAYNSVSIELKFLAFVECTYTYNYVWQG